MNCQVWLRRATIAVGALAMSGLATLAIAPASASAMSCFAVAGNVTCINTAVVPVVPFMPPVMGPIGAGGDGEDEHIVIRDDGGRRVARG